MNKAICLAAAVALLVTGCNDDSQLPIDRRFQPTKIQHAGTMAWLPTVERQFSDGSSMFFTIEDNGDMDIWFSIPKRAGPIDGGMAEKSFEGLAKRVAETEKKLKAKQKSQLLISN